jgi:acyl-CoA synthetase (AMP-forming)/AMP-acid ligase II
VGEIGPDGELYVRGRLDDVIVSGGEKVDPLEVEAALTRLPGVKAACVFGSPSPEFGQVVSVALVAEDPKLADPARLRELLAGELSRFKVPRRVVLAEELPLTTSGKVDRRACQLRYAGALSGED